MVVNIYNIGIILGIEASMIFFDGYWVQIIKEQLEMQAELS